MFDPSNLPTVKEVIVSTGLQAEKKFGQNFLLDTNITDKIVRCADNLTDTHAIEIGPGPGGLTRSLLASQATNVTAIEFDPRAVHALAYLQQAAPDRFHLHQADALQINLMDLVPAPRAIVANLPYNVATPLVTSWLSQIAEHGKNAYTGMTLMFQKEVTDRIVAEPNSKAYGRLSIICQWLCEVEQKYVLPPEAFSPPPKVKSAIVHFRPRVLSGDQPAFKAVEAVTEAAFGQRRKMIRQSLKRYSQGIEKLGLDPTVRAENLSVSDYIALAKIGPNTEETL